MVIRAARPDDVERMLEAFLCLEPGSIYTRFFGPKTEVSDAEIHAIRETDFDRFVRLLCIIERDGREVVIAEGVYARTADDEAEVAFLVEEDYQRLGIAARLLQHLRRIALDQGLKRFTADVLAQNAAMLAVFRGCGLRMEAHRCGGTAHVTLSL